MNIRRGTLGPAELSGVFVLAMFGVFFALDRARMPEAERMAAALETELLAIEPPTGGQMVGGIDRSVKATGVVASKRYTVPGATAPAVTNHFRRQLTEHGWLRCASDDSSLCKGAFRASVEVRPSTAPLEVALVMAWR